MKSTVHKRLIFKANFENENEGPKVINGDEPINVKWIENMTLKNLEINCDEEKDNALTAPTTQK
jgi:hypothetical protein